MSNILVAKAAKTVIEEPHRHTPEKLGRKMTPTCLFTGARLGPDTIIEHTIQRCLGGRILSNEVSSTEFNNRCGSFCDDALSSAYGFLLNRLAPLLPSASQPGAIKAISSTAPDGLVIEPGGILARRGTVVVERYPNGHPKTVHGPDEASMRKFAKRAKMPDNVTVISVPLTDDNVLTTHLRVISPELELAALKSLLLSFDCVMSRDPDRFTRSRHLHGVRSMIQKSVEQKLVNGDVLIKHSLGIQLEKLAFYATLRDRMPFEKTPFEHFMLVAGNLPARCIDAVWVVFGFEPFGFRLCDSYDGPDFCLGLVNPVLKGRSASEVVVLDPQDELLCRPTNRRSFHPQQDTSDLLATATDVVNEIAALRAKAFDRSVFYVHMLPEGEEWLVGRLQHLQSTDGHACMVDLLAARLCSLYPQHESTPEFKTNVTGFLTRRLHECPDDMQTETFEQVESQKTWPRWLCVLRPTLEDLVEVYGMPGGGFFCDGRISNDAETWKKLD